MEQASTASLQYIQRRGIEMVEKRAFETQKAPGFLFSALDKAYDMAVSKRLKAAGVTAIQWSLLDQLYQHEGINQRELAAYCMKDPSSLTKTLDILTKKGLLERRQDDTDRRAFKIFLTEEGRAVHAKAYEITSEFYKIATENLSDEEIDDLYRIMVTIFNNVQASEK